MAKILNIAAGKQKPLPELFSKGGNLIVNIDLNYIDSISVKELEKECRTWDSTSYRNNINLFCNHDIIDYMERTTTIFDSVAIYRFLEHVSFTQVNYFLYLVSTVTRSQGFIDIIVPNYRTLAKMLLEEKMDENFESSNILLTTELLNEPSCPHASIWTYQRLA